MSHSCQPIVASVRFKVPLVVVRRQSAVVSKIWTKPRDLTATGNGAWKVSSLLYCNRLNLTAQLFFTMNLYQFQTYYTSSYTSNHHLNFVLRTELHCQSNSIDRGCLLTRAATISLSAQLWQYSLQSVTVCQYELTDWMKSPIDCFSSLSSWKGFDG